MSVLYRVCLAGGITRIMGLDLILQCYSYHSKTYAMPCNSRAPRWLGTSTCTSFIICNDRVNNREKRKKHSWIKWSVKVMNDKLLPQKHATLNLHAANLPTFLPAPIMYWPHRTPYTLQISCIVWPGLTLLLFCLCPNRQHNLHFHTLRSASQKKQGKR